MEQALQKFFLLCRFVSKLSGFSRSLPVFRTTLLHDRLGSIKGVDGFSRLPLRITSATGLAEPCGVKFSRNASGLSSSVAVPHILGGTQQGVPYDHIAGRTLSTGRGDQAPLNDQRGRYPTVLGRRSAKPTRLSTSRRCQGCRQSVH